MKTLVLILATSLFASSAFAAQVNCQEVQKFFEAEDGSSVAKEIEEIAFQDLSYNEIDALPIATQDLIESAYKISFPQGRAILTPQMVSEWTSGSEGGEAYLSKFELLNSKKIFSYMQWYPGGNLYGVVLDTESNNAIAVLEDGEFSCI